MPVSIPLPSLLASATGIAGSAWASGFIASLSLAGVPGALQLSTPSSTIVWHQLFSRGFALMPKFAVTTTAVYLYAAYTAQQQGRSWKGLVVGAVSTVSIIPFTVLFMSSTNELLLKAVAGTLEASSEDVAKLIGRWGFLNLVRSLIPLTGAAAGFSALFSTL